MDFNELRKKHNQLVYEGFQILPEDGNLKIIFDFLLTPDVRFNPEIILPDVSKARLDEIGPEVLQNLVFNLGMVELLSYWKAACPLEIIIKAGNLNDEQIKFWKNLLIKGLGEFFYTNKIDFTRKDIVKFVSNKLRDSSSETPQNDKYNGDLKDRDLVLVGGGKDSAVTLESISQKGKELNCLILNPTESAIKIAEVGGCKKPIIIKRTIDPKLIGLNKQGYLNGHTPFSAYLAFLSTFVGVLYDFKNLVVSNEASSNEGNVKWMGQEINHQYSKTSEFEQDFRDYSGNYLSASSNYFSFLRPLGELQISELFSKMEKYHRLFRSCNRGSKQGVWCGKCPKCVSTYLLLYPFLGSKTADIFGKDLLEDEKIIPVIRSLLRENDIVKPFECVATVLEIKTAISLGIKKAKKDGQQISKILESFQKTLILGFGREGKSTLDYFKKHNPDMEVGIADQSDGEDYLKKIKDYDLIIKSPGVPYLPEIKEAQLLGKTISSATQIFFAKFSGKIIGVTGTKGKSTTASLIYEVLKKGGLDVHLVGNIGKPALELLDQLNEDSIVVYELSSFQLEDLSKSPHIAVITNLYAEHLDHHGDFFSYKEAKTNIAKFQTKKDYLIYNQDIPELRYIAEQSKANKIPFSSKDKQMVSDLVHKDTIPLLGEFNLLNTVPAVIIGRLFKVADNKIEEAIINFRPLPHRLEFVAETKGIRFYNDSLSTIPQATAEALSALGKNVETLIAGGYDRGLDYSVLGEAIAKSGIKTLILFPETGIKIWEALELKMENLKLKIKKFNTESMKEAVELAFKHTAPGKIVLLSPASTSFNLFRDYEDRGNQFKEWVKKLGAD
ncbi:UDP-N-acetylmuramoylalanine--D-glutamate ligase [Candidatus Daviesbacteria bacterium RIFCSPLOWO2_02_FULL_41_8]|uniref:Multifunctional fusion protein n=3 Tax=Candidatus Daviesiibacteriota TaxID=1752718 RepID=A0A1F5NIS7_9BACT|nr:MAG: UDP-N-acetylmuramoylalanine--D-glutamate ligase [Candidatus Daviesbacteria bacterium RIFCSPHIGHO2_01_FULL_41_23]OGE33446.1 MAG: UDP-N-acetylmuramoylalanine--D-glutamate ligase [Candidatus Daviesbacteria bacterium RIFCSPHIGHO2_02_FULL_41_10]OGE62435.1 MAG: UDP-N-acetylmuramoylalanine--D-glutamate ligase [Candidatus Daviesbacteria bacterium RIFCSPLOWO2_01_FULL_41_32]OGE77330.1 MAG: UDP-N-acetylmuramoylalanine--D-glutamate ligase [Candidatus Daviesbacteria bacterium RIFCSPLOWO2_02_FULL_41_8